MVDRYIPGAFAVGFHGIQMRHEFADTGLVDIGGQNCHSRSGGQKFICCLDPVYPLEPVGNLCYSHCATLMVVSVLWLIHSTISGCTISMIRIAQLRWEKLLPVPSLREYADRIGIPLGL